MVDALNNPAEQLAEQATRLEAQGYRPYIVPVGGSNALGALGYVECAQGPRRRNRPHLRSDEQSPARTLHSLVHPAHLSRRPARCKDDNPGLPDAWPVQPLDGVSQNRFRREGPLLFIHTGGAPALFAYHPSV